jgi:hypothetical protein
MLRALRPSCSWANRLQCSSHTPNAHPGLSVRTYADYTLTEYFKRLMRNEGKPGDEEKLGLKKKDGRKRVKMDWREKVKRKKIQREKQKPITPLWTREQLLQDSVTDADAQLWVSTVNIRDDQEERRRRPGPKEDRPEGDRDAYESGKQVGMLERDRDAYGSRRGVSMLEQDRDAYKSRKGISMLEQEIRDRAKERREKARREKEEETGRPTDYPNTMRREPGVTVFRPEPKVANDEPEDSRAQVEQEVEQLIGSRLEIVKTLLIKRTIEASSRGGIKPEDVLDKIISQLVSLPEELFVVEQDEIEDVDESEILETVETDTPPPLPAREETHETTRETSQVQQLQRLQQDPQTDQRTETLEGVPQQKTKEPSKPGRETAGTALKQDVKEEELARALNKQARKARKVFLRAVQKVEETERMAEAEQAEIKSSRKGSDTETTERKTGKKAILEELERLDAQGESVGRLSAKDEPNKVEKSVDKESAPPRVREADKAMVKGTVEPKVTDAVEPNLEYADEFQAKEVGLSRKQIKKVRQMEQRKADKAERQVELEALIARKEEEANTLAETLQMPGKKGAKSMKAQEPGDNKPDEAGMTGAEQDKTIGAMDAAITAQIHRVKETDASKSKDTSPLEMSELELFGELKKVAADLRLPLAIIGTAGPESGSETRAAADSSRTTTVVTDRKARRRQKLIDAEEKRIRDTLGLNSHSTEPNWEVQQQVTRFIAKMDAKTELREARKAKRNNNAAKAKQIKLETERVGQLIKKVIASDDWKPSVHQKPLRRVRKA